MQKDQNPSARGTSVLLPAAEQEGGRVAQQVCVIPLTLFTACPWLLCPTRYLFLDPFFVETSVLSAHHSEAAFSSSCVCGKHNQREKSMYPRAIKKINSFHRIYI